MVGCTFASRCPHVFERCRAERAAALIRWKRGTAAPVSSPKEWSMSADEQPLVVVRQSGQAFSGAREAGSRRERRGRPRAGWRQPDHQRGRSAGTRGRVGLRQDDARSLYSALDRTDRAGKCSFDQTAISAQVKGTDLRRLRAEMQIVFQNPLSSLNPRMRIRADPGRTAADAPNPARRMAAAHPRAVGAGRAGRAAPRPLSRTNSPAGSVSASPSRAR